MTQDRRDFLKTGLAGTALIAAGTGILESRPALAQAAAPAPAASGGAMARGMIFATLRKGDRLSLGIKTDKGILDVARAEQDLKAGVPTTISDVLAGKNVGQLAAFVDKARGANNAAYFIAEKDAQFGPAVTHPEKIICVGLNYRKHAAETGNPVPPVPILFNKYSTALNHHGGTIKVSAENAEKFDYEAELVVVIGRTARNVAEKDALDYVLGYCTGNDFTARDLQSRTSQWMVGKTLDGSGPIGPWLVTKDLADGDNLKIELKVNGQVRQSESTSDMVFGVKPLVSYISKYMTLKPGDIIFTGTPSGVISGMPKDKQVWLKPGDKIVTSIEKLGDLEFTLT
jgi:2-keto-4-pentenoate hydratase/2-oxohepta-3-ene-1,7-dioic acid hydratase in catechol pathway